MSRSPPRLAVALLGIAVACSDSATDPIAEPVPTAVVVSALSLEFSSLGETAQLSATVHDQNGEVMAGATVAWVSTHPLVATVDGNGLVSAAGNGATNITVTAGTTATASVGVTVEQVAAAIVLSAPPDSMAVGDSVRMNAEALDALENAIADVTFEWSSSDTTVVTVNPQGWVFARAGGSAEITAAIGTTASATVVIMSVQVPGSIELSVPGDSVEVGDSIQLAAKAIDALGNPIADVILAWSSSDTTVATVDQQGWVRARTAGSTEITVTAGTTASATVAVSVVQVPAAIVLSAPRDSVMVGDSIQVAAEAFDALGNPMADVTFAWSSSDTAIATVDQQGWVRARAAGAVGIGVELGELNAATSLVVLPDEDRERAALEAFYHATNGPEWENNANWLTDKPLGEWYGVQTDASGEVVGLRFNKNRLRGPLTAELAHLTSLRTLSLWGGGDWEPGTNLTGPIPPELAELGNLTELNLGNNELTGEIPFALADLTNLTTLSLVQNRLTGRIPPELGRLTNLQHLSLGGNRLTGNVPAELGNLTELTGLYLADTGLTGKLPVELGNLLALRELWLGHNDLTGEIPAGIGSLARLEILYLIDNGLSGPIPPELGGLAQLRWLILADNDLTGWVPPELGNLHNLERLELDGNGLHGPIPPELGRLARLKALALTGNPITGAIPPELAGLTQLEFLRLDGTRLSGPIPPELGRLASIERLFLGGYLTGRIPPELGNLVTLRRLEIASHSLEGPIPPEPMHVDLNDYIAMSYTRTIEPCITCNTKK